MAKIKTTFICTVLNEEESIEKLLNSLKTQTICPDEVIIVDGGSSDKTVAQLKAQSIRQTQDKSSKLNVPLRILVKQGNRAVGRNFAIKNAKHEIILCSDAGCELDKRWIEHMTSSFKQNIDVVSGYYKGIASSILQQCLIPYVLIMPDRVDEKNFLPATRSMGFTKSIWKQIGGFPEKYSDNEDYVFANKLKNVNAAMIFNKKAIVYWYPPNSLQKTFYMFFRFARGDIEARILRPKVILIFLRYIGGFYLGIVYPPVLLFLVCLYVVWAIKKNYRYIKHPLAFFYLPFLQVLSDIAVISGSIIGWYNRVR